MESKRISLTHALRSVLTEVEIRGIQQASRLIGAASAGIDDASPKIECVETGEDADDTRKGNYGIADSSWNYYGN
jgi:hypothetical protein